ncbi:hypothetical protein [Longispora albida]|uniref:hypothetical protein n=1 Tax=Longispora albida TaxID=203523 RepID=UPI000379CB3C|nr:hypothetical protein [Longispora albida]
MDNLSTGQVLVWHDEDGWGVVRSPDVPGDVWVLWAALRIEGARGLEPGAVVQFSWEEAAQDGFAYRAVEVFVEGRPAVYPVSQLGGTAYRSQLSIEFDPE